MNVLVIEDDESSLELLRLRLETLGCRVCTATSPQEGLAKAQAERPDMIMLDLGYHTSLRATELAGIHLIDDLRASPETADIPIIVHSVHARGGYDRPKHMAEPDGYLLKPFKFDQLRALIEGARPERPHPPTTHD